MKQKIIIIAGPTAVGKTAAGVMVARTFNGEVISADSVQVYRGADIGSAKVTKSEMQGIPHHLIDICAPDDTFNAGEFAGLAKQKIAEIAARGKVPILVGGTGLYISSLLFPLTSSGAKDDKLRTQLYDYARMNGAMALFDKLKSIDPETAQKLHPNQLDRIVRAIEIFKTTGVKKSSLVRTLNSEYDYLLIVLTDAREALYSRINARVDEMINAGLIDEVRGLVERYNLTKNNQIMQGIGYKEVYDYLTGKTGQKTCIDLIKQRSRNYAKRQLTWFKKMPNAVFVNASNRDEIIPLCEKFLKDK